MVLKLDPRIPVVWRDPSSLQFGVAAPVAILTDVSSATEHMVAALSSGVSRSGLFMIGRAQGATDAEVTTLLDRMTPALLPEDNRRVVKTVLVAGSGPTAHNLALDLAAAGLRVLIARNTAAAASASCDFAVIVSHFVVAPEFHGLWLRRDVPHLPVVISDADVVIGPIVEPGIGPCLHCMQRYRSEADAAWPAIATQLLGRPPVAESALVATEAAAMASRITARRMAGAASSVHESRSISLDTGVMTVQEWEPHSSCGCIEPGGLPLQRVGVSGQPSASGQPGAPGQLGASGQVSAPAQRGTDSPGAGPLAGPIPLPTREQVSSGLE